MDHHKLANLLGALAVAVVDNMEAAVAEATALGEGEAAAIVLVSQHPGLSIDRLRLSLGLSHPGAVRLVDRLETDGLLRRGTSPADGRRRALRLTSEGEAALSSLLAGRRAALVEALSALDAQQRDALGPIVETLLGTLTTDAVAADRICRLCDEPACGACPVERRLPGGRRTQGP